MNHVKCLQFLEKLKRLKLIKKYEDYKEWNGKRAYHLWFDYYVNGINMGENPRQYRIYLLYALNDLLTMPLKDLTLFMDYDLTWQHMNKKGKEYKLKLSGHNTAVTFGQFSSAIQLANQIVHRRLETAT